MSWKEADQKKYAVVGRGYASDLSDAEFERLFPLLPCPKARGRKPTDLRKILNAIFYLLRTGCQWRLLPKDFPPYSTVQNHFYPWRDEGIWSQILTLLELLPEIRTLT